TSRTRARFSVACALVTFIGSPSIHHIFSMARYMMIVILPYMTAIIPQPLNHLHQRRFSQDTPETPAQSALRSSPGPSAHHSEGMSIPTDTASHRNHLCSHCSRHRAASIHTLLPAGGTDATTVTTDDTAYTSSALLTPDVNES